MLNLPLFIPILFVITTLVTIFFLCKASINSLFVFAIISLFLVLQSFLSIIGFYASPNAVPPRFPLLILPSFVVIIILFATKKGRVFIDGLNVNYLAILHIIRIPVELVLYWLFLYKYVPQLMTFEGRNFDILSGITSPFIWYFGFVKRKLSKKVILAWNYICLGLLVNIVLNAALSVPSPFQQFAFKQPNIAILYFPYLWLPCIVVPIVLFSHLVLIRRLRKNLTLDVRNVS